MNGDTDITGALTTAELVEFVADHALTTDTDLDAMQETAAASDLFAYSALRFRRVELNAIIREQNLVNVDRGDSAR